jgi:hypothetical protein
MRKFFSVLIKFTGALVLIACLLGAWTIYDTHRYKAFHSAEHVPDLTHYVEHYGNPDKIHRVRVNQRPYYALIPPKGDFMVAIHRPPVFLYDHNGKLWDSAWNPDDAPFAKGNFPIDMVEWDGKVADPKQIIQEILRTRTE